MRVVRSSAGGPVVLAALYCALNCWAARRWEVCAAGYKEGRVMEMVPSWPAVRREAVIAMPLRAARVVPWG